MHDYVPSSGILVVGPHRCGTSAVAGVLHHLGVDMGPQAPPEASAPPSNPLGQFEDHDCIEMCAKLVGNWRFPRARDVYGAPELAAVQNLVGLRAATHLLWGMKDPRLCLCGEAFLYAMQRRRIPAVVLFVYRDLDAAARSLSRRENMPQVASEYLLGRYWMGMERVRFYANDNYQYFVGMEYEKLVADPAGMIRGLAKALHITATPEQLEAAAAHIDPSLNHA